VWWGVGGWEGASVRTHASCMKRVVRVMGSVVECGICWALASVARLPTSLIPFRSRSPSPALQTCERAALEVEECYRALLELERRSQGRVMSRPVSACTRVLAPLLLQEWEVRLCGRVESWWGRRVGEFMGCAVDINSWGLLEWGASITRMRGCGSVGMPSCPPGN